jgi:hypothetical protein
LFLKASQPSTPQMPGAMWAAGGVSPEHALEPVTVVGRGRSSSFDGMRDGGAIIPERSSRLLVRWSRHESADDLIVRIVAESPEGTLVATDDIDLGARARATGAASVRSRQLIERFARQRASAPSVGHGRPTPPTRSGIRPGNEELTRLPPAEARAERRGRRGTRGARADRRRRQRRADKEVDDGRPGSVDGAYRWRPSSWSARVPGSAAAPPAWQPVARRGRRDLLPAASSPA